MSDLGLTWFDGLALVVILISAARAYQDGFVKDIFGVIAFVAAIAVAIMFTPELTARLQEGADLDGTWVPIAVAVGLLAVVYLAVTLVAGRFVRSIDRSASANAIDNAVGGVYGIARGVLLVALLVFALKWVAGDPEKGRHTLVPEAVTKAATYPFFDSLAETIPTWPGRSE